MTHTKPLSHEFWGALNAAKSVVETFRARYDREPTDAELRVAASLFIEFYKSNGKVPFVAAGKPESKPSEEPALSAQE